MMKQSDFSKFDNSYYKVGASYIKQVLWYLTNCIFFRTGLPFIGKATLLRLFGAKVGKNVCIKPRVNIKYPWKLHIENHVWIGENVWIDNLDEVRIGKNVCISQGALLLCGNHNYKKESFDLITGPIHIEDGVWICANATVTQNVICKSHSVLGVGSVANQDLDEYTIYSGVPAIEIRKRIIG